MSDILSAEILGAIIGKIGDVFTPAVSGIFGAFVGTFCSAWFVSIFNNSGNRAIRKICVKALDVLKKKEKFSSSSKEFNSEISISEKRAILVCLHKIGVPIATYPNGRFNIKNVSFLEGEVTQSEIKLMKSQINKGMCDHYFFVDADNYFNNDIRSKTIRDLAKKYVDNDMKNMHLNIENDAVELNIDFGKYSPIEIELIATFIYKSKDRIYFDNENRKINSDMLAKVKEEIDLGLWDSYLGWEINAYQNTVRQNEKAMSENKNPPDENSRNIKATEKSDGTL